MSQPKNLKCKQPSHFWVLSGWFLALGLILPFSKSLFHGALHGWKRWPSTLQVGSTSWDRFGARLGDMSGGLATVETESRKPETENGRARWRASHQRSCGFFQPRKYGWKNWCFTFVGPLIFVPIVVPKNKMSELNFIWFWTVSVSIPHGTGILNNGSRIFNMTSIIGVCGLRPMKSFRMGILRLWFYWFYHFFIAHGPLQFRKDLNLKWVATLLTSVYWCSGFMSYEVLEFNLV